MRTSSLLLLTTLVISIGCGAAAPATQSPTRQSEPTSTPVPTSTPTNEPAPATAPTPEPAPTVPAPPTLTREPFIDTDTENVIQKVSELVWISDGLSEVELEAAEELYRIAQFRPKLAEALVLCEWLQDGLDANEIIVMQSINAIAQGGQEAERNEERAFSQAVWIMNMPFLETIDAIDAEAADSLASISLFDQELFERLLSHPRLQPDGLTDQNTIWVSMLALAYLVDANQPGNNRFDAVWNGQLRVTETTIQTPLSGTIDLIVVGIEDEGSTLEGALQLANLEQAARGVETVMKRQLPSKRLVLVLTQGSWVDVHGIMTVRPDDFDWIVLQEVARHYWGASGYPNWLTDGATETVVDLVRNQNPVASSSGCGYPGKPIDVQPTILMIEEEHGLGALGCKSVIGEGIFDDLYATLGKQRFMEQFRTLYDWTKNRKTNDEPHVCEFYGIWAQGSDGSTQQDIKAVLEKWYGGALEC